MANQQAIFAETIAGMKKAVKRKAYDSDSDSSIDQLTNRGNKLRKKARFVHEGQLAPPSGPRVYRRNIEHAGYHRDIISRNPSLIDEDGYEVDSEDDDERAQAAHAAAAEFDPYADVKIEHLLAPLTAASDLSDHPTLSKPFTSKTLTQLTEHARDMVQKEKTSLWKLKHLFTKMSGDNTWINCGSVEGGNDFALFFDEQDSSRGNQVAKTAAADEADQISTGTLASKERYGLSIGSEALSASMVAAVERIVDKVVTNGDTSSKSDENPASLPEQLEKPENEPIAIDGAVKKAGGDSQTAEAIEAQELDLAGIIGVEDMLMPRRMRTRAQAQADSENATTHTRSMSPDSVNESYIHPYFLATPSSRPDRNVGLPDNEAAETRRVLQLYIQKQEEVCRGVERLYNGLLKADHYRKLVLKWAKAEAHVGVNRDMSDGEDWYDKEEWGLDDSLEKGKDEDEMDDATTAKKTRTRRQ